MNSPMLTNTKKVRVLRQTGKIEPKEEFGCGIYSFMVPPSEAQRHFPDFLKKYRRDNVGLKVFTQEAVMPIRKFKWGGHTEEYKRNSVSNSLISCTKIQNLAAIYNMAPRVYDIVLVQWRGKDHYAQVTDYLPQKFVGNENNVVLNAILEKIERYGVSISKKGGIDGNEKNYLYNKLVDFQFLEIDECQFQRAVKEDAGIFSAWGSKDFSYESVDELGIVGQRDTQRRIEVLGLDKIDFEGKTVLDVGCSTGSFCRYAARRGASRVVGVDIGNTIIASESISTYLGDYNIDHYDIHLWEEINKLKELVGFEKFDIVLFLSVHQQVGYVKDMIERIAGDYLFLEGHSGDHEETYTDMLKEVFKEVTFQGRMKNNSRPAFMCRRGGEN